MVGTQANSVLMAGLALVALGLLVAGAALAASEWRRLRAGQRVQRSLERAQAAAQRTGAADELLLQPAPTGTDGGLPAGATLPRTAAATWLDTALARKLVSDEDRRLIDQCGYPSLRAQQGFLAARVVLAVLLPLLGVTLGGGDGSRALATAALLFAVGFMAPKWFLAWRAAHCRREVARELPLFVDVLRLLQGVGLSLDQSLQVIANDFSGVLRILGREAGIANRQYAQGRTREHSLQRIATLHGNEQLANLVALLVQVDRHGGAVQEPLRIFGERLREWRKFDAKERIGRVTVKMTVVMITTLLPALLIITAGPGFLAVLRSLGSIGR